MTLNPEEIQAVFWDFDGVILDTEPLHWMAFKEVLNPAGIDFSWDQYRREYMGFDDRDALEYAFTSHNMPLNHSLRDNYMHLKAESFQRLATEKSLEPYPGVRDLIQHWHGRLPQAICSGALLRDILPLLQRLGLSEYFDAVITADQVSASKPDPETYGQGLNALNLEHGPLEPSQCLAVEDTPTGITSAKGAGLYVLAVGHTHPESDLQDADRVVSSLPESGFLPSH